MNKYVDTESYNKTNTRHASIMISQKLKVGNHDECRDRSKKLNQIYFLMQTQEQRENLRMYFISIC